MKVVTLVFFNLAKLNLANHYYFSFFLVNIIILLQRYINKLLHILIRPINSVTMFQLIRSTKEVRHTKLVCNFIMGMIVCFPLYDCLRATGL